MTTEPPSTGSHRVAASDDLEVSAYLEIAKEKSGQETLPRTASQLERESILVVDFGSQYSRLIARRIRESNVYCEIVSHKATWESVAHLNPKGVVLSGGPASVYDPNAPMAPTWTYERGLPVLGICFGRQESRIGNTRCPNCPPKRIPKMLQLALNRSRAALSTFCEFV